MSIDNDLSDRLMEDRSSTGMEEHLGEERSEEAPGGRGRGKVDLSGAQRYLS